MRRGRPCQQLPLCLLYRGGLGPLWLLRWPDAPHRAAGLDPGFHFALWTENLSETQTLCSEAGRDSQHSWPSSAESFNRVGSELEAAMGPVSLHFNPNLKRPHASKPVCRLREFMRQIVTCDPVWGICEHTKYPKNLKTISKHNSFCRPTSGAEARGENRAEARTPVCAQEKAPSSEHLCSARWMSVSVQSTAPPGKHQWNGSH